MTQTYENYIGGEWTGSGETQEVTNPADETDVVSTVPVASAADADEAVAAAAAATDEWDGMPGPERGAILRETGEILKSRKDKLAETLTREEGKPLGEAEGEVQRAIDIFYYYAEKARDFGGTVKQPSGGRAGLQTKKEPMGVAALITPWNYPIAIPAWKIAPALAVGNTVVIKPAMQAPTVGAMIVEALDEAGIPDGAINLVCGPGSEVGERLTTHDDVDVVSFTGSASVGEHVYEQATSHGKRAQAEMGGKNPTVVMPSADVDKAADIVGAGAFGGTGQACTATSRAIVHEDVYNEFLDAIVDYAESLEIGDGLDRAGMGPHVSEDELAGSLEYIDIAQSEGATLETGGEELTGGEYDAGNFISPAVFSDVEPDMRIAQEEVFGPVLAVMSVSDFDEGVEVANDIDYGLSASIVTDRIEEENEFIEQSESGVVKVNEKTTGLELHVPFGGLKRSSTNTYREQGDAGLEFFSYIKTVYRNS
ncbi:aldehyde dehydrogenase family protein [Haloarcula sp. NS06]|uniref:2,5-dioxovalerate dehydrogenase n=1 Tax=unclassified Haloarcula TaxID=2624677 RepID=UPI0027B30B91|nr:aldehyde dehydrogenase family protein [Haloarcula sp. H-GB4]MDQ2070964.1 aldehyde dehydrogenase family protein [Haloarcula sp. H-GB4]